MESSGDTTEGDKIQAGNLEGVQGAAIGRQSSAASANVTINNLPPAEPENPSLADMIRMTWTHGLSTQADLRNLEQTILNLPTRHDLSQLKADVRRLQEENRKVERLNTAKQRAEDEERRQRQKETDQHRAMLTGKMSLITNRMSKLEQWFKGWTIIILLLCALDLYLIFDLASRLGWLGRM